MIIWIFVLILSSVISERLEDSRTSDVIKKCEIEDAIFTQLERNYSYEGGQEYGRGEVQSLAGFPQRNPIAMKYEKEANQRIFECIHDSLNRTSNSKLQELEIYKKLVRRCRSHQTIVRCDPLSPYRTFNGTCNNLRNPTWGSSLSCLNRYMYPCYKGVAGFRQSVCGGPLPEPRKISVHYHSSRDRSNQELSNMFPFFGQLLAHDITDVPVVSVRSMTINCCAKNVSKDDLHPQCAPIYIPSSDPFYSKYNVTCVNFIRSAPCATCSTDKRNQMNEVTAFIDASFNYGSDDNTSKEMRAYDGNGKLMAQHRKAGELLPANPLLNSTCGSQQKRQYCFRSGDRRTNQHTPLMCQHTIWIREHNRIATGLKKLNPKWPEEKLFQETRKIIIALLQCIVYKEFLPLLVGGRLMTHYDLWVRREGNTRYNPWTNPTIMTEFNTACYRLHSLIHPRITKHPIDDGKQCLRDMYTRASPIYDGYLDEVLEGMCQKPAQKYDRFVTTDMTQFLNRPPGEHGRDMAAINIQRGRDHGLPPYVDVVHFLSGGQINISRFDDLVHFIDQENIDKLKKLYCDVKDVDLGVALNSERVPKHMVLGKTAATIDAIQFHRLKFGDRFFFEHRGVFTKDQLKAVKKYTLSKLLCENTNINQMQANALMLPSSRNPFRPCSEIPGLDLNAWKEDTENHE